ncbi:hypothetical protein D3C72_1767700 [compost metagenome]
MDGVQPETAIIVGVVVHQADDANEPVRRLAGADRPMPLRASPHGGQGERLDELPRAIGRIRPGHPVGQESHHFPLGKNALDGVGVLQVQGAQDEAGGGQDRRRGVGHRGLDRRWKALNGICIKGVLGGVEGDLYQGAGGR